MFLQKRHAAEGARADAALVLLYLSVGLQVGPQVGAVRKRSAAVGAREWTLACVCADVAAQQPGPGERLPAGGANTG